MFSTWNLRKNSFLSAILYRYSASLILYLSAFIVGMFVSKKLGPEMLGYWGVFHILTSYYAYSNLGATNGLTRELGILIGKKEKNSITNIVGAANAIHLIFPGLISLTLIIGSLFLSPPMNWLFLFAGIIGFVQLFEESLIRIINAFERHKELARISVFRSIISFLIIVPMVYFFDLHGRILAALIIAIIGLLVAYRYLPLQLNINFDKKHIKKLITIGFPIALSGFLATNFFLVDRLVITKFLTIEELGLYTFAFYLVTVVKNIKTNVANILYQRQNIIFGQSSSESSKHLLEVSKSSTLFTTDLTGLLSGLLLIPFSFFVKYFMPEYINSLPLTYIIVFSQVMGSINVFNTVGKHKQYLYIMAFSLGVNIVLSIIFSKLWGIIGIAYATFLSFLIFNSVISFANLRYFSLSLAANLKLNFRIIIIPLYCYSIAKGIEILLFKHQSTILGKDLILMIGLLLLYSVFMIPLIFMLKKHIIYLNQVKVGEEKC